MKMIFNRTKIIATLGPASGTRKVMEKLVDAGVDVFRLNFSHGSHEDHLILIKQIRDINRDRGLYISTLLDLQGPKIRVGNMENGQINLISGQELIICSKQVIGNNKRISTVYQSLFMDVKKGESILLDDGKIELIVKGVSPKKKEVMCRVKVGGVLSDKKGMNLPNTVISAPSLTPKDIKDLEFGIQQKVDWVALSFVRSAKDVLTLKKKIQDLKGEAKVISKIEKPEGVANIDDIIHHSDAIMVARGDMGVEVPMEDVPMIQKKLVKKCNLTATPVIIATQMMESMIENARPTRAEANDVANAVFDGADTLMLSGETAMGKYPVETVQSMTKIIDNIEEKADIYYKNYDLEDDSETFVHDSVISMACGLADASNAKAITGMTFSGYTAFRLARHRPKSYIFVFTANKNILSTLNLLWGVRGIYYDKFESTDGTIEDLEKILKKIGVLSKGDVYINTASIPMYKKQRTNMVKLSEVE
jgi:pyruvate kinase